MLSFHLFRCQLLSRVLSRNVSANTQLKRVGKYTRVKELAKVLRLSTDRILKDVALKHKRHLFCCFDDIWYKFRKQNDIIVPYSVAKMIAVKHGLNIAPLPEPLLVPSKNRYPVIALLGHFNHGKTTLLDYLSGTNWVDVEAHQITQVRLNVVVCMI